MQEEPEIEKIAGREEHCRLCKYHDYRFYANDALTLNQRVIDVCCRYPPAPVNDVYSTLSHQAATGVRIGAFPIIPGEVFRDKWCGEFTHCDKKAKIFEMMVKRGDAIGHLRKIKAPTRAAKDKPGKEDDHSVRGHFKPFKEPPPNTGAELARKMLKEMEEEEKNGKSNGR